MKILKLLAGLITLLLSIGYLFRPDRILKLNELGRHVIFNDSYVLKHRIRIGVFFLLLAFIALYMSFSAE